MRDLRASTAVTAGAGSGLPRAAACVWCDEALGPEAEHRGRLTFCPRCGAATTDPPPDAAELEAAYGDWYRPAGGRRFSFAGDAILGWTRGRLAGRLDRIAPPGKVLDVGAGDGTLVDALQARGRAAEGLERNDARPDFRDEPITAVEGDGEWSAVVFWHALEHLPAPGEAIREAARLLAPGGVVVVAVPNTASVQFATFDLDWLHLDLPRHLVHLPQPALLAGLQRNGFTIKRISQVRAGQIVIGWLHGLVGRLPGRPQLYDALRRGAARGTDQSAAKRAYAVLAGIVLLPVAAAASLAEIARGRSGTVYVEAQLRSGA